MATIDTLDIKITANATNAAKALNSLADSLKRVRAALMNTKDGVSVGDRLAKSVNELNNAMTRINTHGIKKLNQLSDALTRFAAAAKSMKGVSINKSTAKSIQNVQGALGTKSGMASSKGGSASVSAGVEKVGEETEKAGEKAKKAAGFFGKLWSSIKRIAFYRLIRSAMKAIGEAFSEGLKNAYHYSKQSETFQRLADTLDRLTSSSSQMVNQIGAFWGEFKQFIQPAVLWLIEKVRQLSEWITELFAALNGEKTYLQAQYVAQAWDDATDNVKKYKQQLLGLDELNNLSSQQSSGKEETDYSKLYKEVSVSEGLLKVGVAWGALKQMIIESLTEIEIALGGFMVGVGAALLFSGANIPLGLGLIIAGGFMVGKAIKENWGSMKGNLEETLANIELALGGFMAGIGAVLLFSGAAPQWGLGLLIAGIGVFSAAKKRKTNWDKIDRKTKDTLTLINLTLGGFLSVIGAVLLFSGANIPLGLGCLIAGIATISSNAKAVKDLDWDRIRKQVEGAFIQFKPYFFAAGLGSMVAGAILLFTGHIGLGLGLLIGGGFLTANTIRINWDSLLEGIKGAWKKTKDWIEDNILYYLYDKYYGLEKLFKRDLNGDGNVGWPTVKEAISVGTKQIDDLDKWFGGSGGTKGDSSGTTSDKKSLLGTLWEDTKKDLDMWASQAGWYDIIIPFTGKTLGDYIAPKALGGIAAQGSLFYAGEAGPEFVGNMGGSSAVANTEQMTEAIYKAAYMGMSRALQENGGNGLSGFVPATTDDLFIAMRKKASNYNKMTGSSAFA